MNIIHCENCRFWQDGYCTLRKKRNERRRNLRQGRRVLKRRTKTMSKFKVGDIIKANEMSNKEYIITNQERNWTGKILSIENGRIYAETITPTCYKGDKYRLIEKYFDLVQE